MFSRFLVVLIFLLSCQCLALEIGGSNILHSSKISGEPLPFQRGVRVRKNVEPAVNIQSNKPKIFFCCEQNQIFLIEKGIDEKCSHKNGTGKPEFPPIYTDDLKVSGIDPWTHFDIRHEYPCKNKSQTMNWSPPNNDYFYILENGTIFFDNSLYLMPNSTGNKDAYCLANMMRKNKTYSTVRVCFPAQKTQEEVPLVYPITLTVSIPLLIATFLVYACLPELRNIHGLTLMAYIACLCLAFIFLSVIQFGGSKLVESKKLCISLAFSTYFFYLAAFLWSNVMCFNIWRIIRGFRSLQSSVSQHKRKKFIIYSLYAWGCASLLTGICLILDLVPGVPENIIKPQLGMTKCWFSDGEARIIYFLVPMSIMIIINTCLFISTAITIWMERKENAKHLQGMDSQCHKNKTDWFNIYLKLMIIMGISWSVEVISPFFVDQSDRSFTWITVVDMKNTLEGVFIFLIFVRSRKVKGILLKRKDGNNRKPVLTSSMRTDNSTRSQNSTRTSIVTSGAVISIILLVLFQKKSVS